MKKILIIIFFASLMLPLGSSCNRPVMIEDFFKDPHLPDACSTSGNNKWKYIIIHHSGKDTGNGWSLHMYHYKKNWGGLAYHFVVNRFRNMKDPAYREGNVQAGYRWIRQLQGMHVHARQDYYNRHGIGICLIGDLNSTMPTMKQQTSLVRLTLMLMKAYNISTKNIIGHREVPFDTGTNGKSVTSCPGRNFSMAGYRNMISFITSSCSAKEPVTESEVTELIQSWKLSNSNSKTFP
jgi:hypothetical protein